MERRVFITGSDGSLGKELVNVFKKNNIFVVYHKHKISSSDNFVIGDICNEQTQDEILKSFIENNCNVLINNVGIYNFANFMDHSDDMIYKIINTNLTSTILITKKILGYLLTNGEGMIYNINSIAGIMPSENESVYCASKFGLKGFTDSLSKEFRHLKKLKLMNVTIGAFKSKITKNRNNYTELADPFEIAEKIYWDVMESFSSIKSELIIYRK